MTLSILCQAKRMAFRRCSAGASAGAKSARNAMRNSPAPPRFRRRRLMGMLGNLRGEIRGAFERGDRKIDQLMQGRDRLRTREILVPAGEPHEFVYRLREGWAGRARALPDGRTQYI